MEIPRLREMRPRTVWDVVDDAFDLYRERFALFAGIASVVLVPATLLLGLVSLWFVQSATTPNADALSGAVGGLVVALPFYGVAYVLYGGASAAAVDDVLNERPTGVGAAYRRAFRRFWPLLGASLIVGVLALLGACAAYIGTLLVFVYYGFVAQAVVLEGRGALASGRRSRDLVGGSGDKVLGLILVLGLLTMLLSLGITILFASFLSLVPTGAGDAAARELRLQVVQQAVQTVIAVLLAPITPIAQTMMYYDLRVRREGLDMVAQAQAIGFPLAPDPFGDLSSARALAAQQRRERAGR